MVSLFLSLGGPVSLQLALMPEFFALDLVGTSAGSVPGLLTIRARDLGQKGTADIAIFVFQGMFLGFIDASCFAAKATESLNNRVLCRGLLCVGHLCVGLKICVGLKSLKLGFAINAYHTCKCKKAFQFFLADLNSLKLKYLFSHNMKLNKKFEISSWVHGFIGFQCMN